MWHLWRQLIVSRGKPKTSVLGRWRTPCWTVRLASQPQVCLKKQDAQLLKNDPQDWCLTSECTNTHMHSPTHLHIYKHTYALTLTAVHTQHTQVKFQTNNKRKSLSQFPFGRGLFHCMAGRGGCCNVSLYNFWLSFVSFYRRGVLWYVTL